MTRKNLAYYDEATGTGYLTVVDDYETYEETTTVACPDRYIRVIDKRRQYPQLCRGGGRTGNTLIWAANPDDMAEGFANGCNARLYKTRVGYDRARNAVRP